MPLIVTLILILLIGVLAGRQCRAKALGSVGGQVRELHSLPGHYGWYGVAWTCVPPILVVFIWVILGPAVIDTIMTSTIAADYPLGSANDHALYLKNLRSYIFGDVVSAEITQLFEDHAAQYRFYLTVSSWGLFVVSMLLAGAGFYWSLRHVNAALRARNRVERIVNGIMAGSSIAAILVTAGIILSLIFEAYRFFTLVPIGEFIFGLEWSPQIALRADQVASEGSFGAVPLFSGTLLITFIAMCVAVPVGLMSAIYMTQYADPRLRAFAKPALEILAGVPTVVYGFFAALVIAPAIREYGMAVGLDVASESALAAGLVMGVMIIPFMSSLSDDALAAVPQAMKDGAYALGATRAETIRQVLIPAALPGIIGAFLLSVSRAIGETMIVVMAAGLAANLTANPLEAVTTVTVQIVTLLTGDQEFDSAKTLAAFALGLALFIVTLAINVIALRIVKTYREQYE